MGRHRLRRELEAKFWQGIGLGMANAEASAAAGVSATTGVLWFRRRGGVTPSIVHEPQGYRLSFAEREEIACLNA
jgi:hypothetical protein